MDWLQALTIIVANMAMMASVMGLFLWSRSESRADIRMLIGMIDTFQKEIRQEMKDFHGRLCAIEERRKKEK